MRYYKLNQIAVMKKLLLIVLLLIGTSVSGQKLTGNVFTTELKDGADVKKKVTLVVSNISVIDTSFIFKEWVNETYNNPKNAEWIKNNASYSKMELFLRSNITMTYMLGKMKLNNENSLTFIEGSEGQMYLTDTGKLNISFTAKVNNNNGTPVIVKFYGTTEWKEAKLEYSAFLDY